MLDYESKLHNYNTYIVINIGENNKNSSNYANNVVSSSSSTSSDGFNVNLSNVNLSIGNFGDRKSNNAGFVGRNINDLNYVNSIS